jgi:hypothetical protein
VPGISFLQANVPPDATMLRTITLERALIFFATLAAITQSEANHDLESRYPREAAHEQSFMTDDSHVVTCARIEESLSVSQVFYKGTSVSFDSPIS